VTIRELVYGRHECGRQIGIGVITDVPEHYQILYSYSNLRPVVLVVLNFVYGAVNQKTVR